ncbi:MAG: YggS family pyridoxal phosphate-dependent enzyme [Oscillospiraceae bacterium]|nr:YggS family pyridoxal phosphate-dependent enzyme [Oscillospiraceae bacterium]
MTIAERVLDIRRRIDMAAGGVWRHPITLVAAGKTMPSGSIREAVQAGVDAVGENRVQEMLEKDAQGAYAGAPLHFIGHLQKNKVSKVVGRVSLIQSVDSLPLAQAIDACASRLGVVQQVLLQVNIAREETKGGLDPDAVWDAINALSSLRHIQVRGLMCIPPPLPSKGDTQYFVVMRQLYVDIQGKKRDNICMNALSMGMSDDFESAVRAGANMLRIGTALFGTRSR